MEYLLVLADIIKAKDIGASKSKDYYRSARHKYEKGKLDKYKSACLCTIEHPINELVRVGAIKLASSTPTTSSSTATARTNSATTTWRRRLMVCMARRPRKPGWGSALKVSP